MPLDLSTPAKEGQLQVSKSRILPVLLDPHEMKALFSALEPFSIFRVGRPITMGEAELSKEECLAAYSEYVQGLQSKTPIDETHPFFSSVFTTTQDALYAMQLAGEKILVKSRIPVVQLQRHHFIFSDTFHSGVRGEGSIPWGIQFSYPQLYLDTKSGAIGKVDRSERFPNTDLFKRLTKWVRDYTSATPFIVKGEKINQPMRLGKECFAWINQHPGLQQKELYVAPRKDPSASH